MVTIRFNVSDRLFGILKTIADGHGITAGEVFRIALIEYARENGFFKEEVLPSKAMKPTYSPNHSQPRRVQEDSRKGAIKRLDYETKTYRTADELNADLKQRASKGSP